MDHDSHELAGRRRGRGPAEVDKLGMLRGGRAARVEARLVQPVREEAPERERHAPRLPLNVAIFEEELVPLVDAERRPAKPLVVELEALVIPAPKAEVAGQVGIQEAPRPQHEGLLRRERRRLEPWWGRWSGGRLSSASRGAGSAGGRGWQRGGWPRFLP